MKKALANPTIVTMPIAELRPAHYNPRKIGKRELEGLRASMKRFGNVQPIVWNKRTKTVVGGHQRLRILESEGVRETSVVVVNLSVKDERALNVTLNNPHVAGEFDDSIQALLEEMHESDAELFESLNLNDLIEIEKDDEQSDTDPKLGDVFTFRVVVDCKSEAEQASLLERLSAEGFDVKGMMI